MLLEHKVAVIYGAGGAIGGAVARAFAREGARIFLAGRIRAKLDMVAGEIRANGGVADTAVVDALDHVARRRPRGQELRPRRGCDRLKEILSRYLQQWLLDIAVGDQVERDIDRAGLPDQRVDIRVNRPLIEGIDDRGVRDAAIRANLAGKHVQLGAGAAGQEDAGSLARKGAGHRAADRAARAIDHRNLVLQ